MARDIPETCCQYRMMIFVHDIHEVALTSTGGPPDQTRGALLSYKLLKHRFKLKFDIVKGKNVHPIRQLRCHYLMADEESLRNFFVNGQVQMLFHHTSKLYSAMRRSRKSSISDLADMGESTACECKCACDLTAH